MSEQISINAPFDDKTAMELKAGDAVLITGKILAARDAAHKRIAECIECGIPLPVNLKGQVVYYVGPSPAKPGQVIGSAGPTTSGRMDRYTPLLIKHGLKGMIGKGYRNEEVKEAIKKYKAPYLAATGGAGAMIAKCIKKYQVLAWPELGPEALAMMDVADFPAIVVIDSNGGNYYERGQKPFCKL